MSQKIHTANNDMAAEESIAAVSADSTNEASADETKIEQIGQESAETKDDIAKKDSEETVSSEKRERDKYSAVMLERNAEYFAENYKFADALDSFRQALIYYKKTDDWTGIARIHYRIGFCQEQLKKNNEAFNSYNESKKIYLKLENLDDYSIVSNQLAKAYFFAERKEDAIEEYKETIKLGSKNDEIYNNLGFILIDQGGFQEAEEYLKEAVKLREDKAADEVHLCYNNLGVIQYKLGNYEKAEQYFTLGLERDLRKPEDDRSIQYTVFLKPQFKDKTFSDMLMYQDVDTKACIMLNLAAAQGMQNKMKQAVETCSTALTLDQDRPYLYQAAGWIYLNAGEEKRALEYFRRALPYDPANTDLKTVVDMINPFINMKVGRNDPCPCGSGKKYKKCHAGV